jgi:hypothetical protein
LRHGGELFTMKSMPDKELHLQIRSEQWKKQSKIDPLKWSLIWMVWGNPSGQIAKGKRR